MFYQKVQLSVMMKIKKKKKGAFHRINNALPVLLANRVYNTVRGMAIKMPYDEYLCEKIVQPQRPKRIMPVWSHFKHQYGRRVNI